MFCEIAVCYCPHGTEQIAGISLSHYAEADNGGIIAWRLSLIIVPQFLACDRVAELTIPKGATQTTTHF